MNVPLATPLGYACLVIQESTYKAWRLQLRDSLVKKIVLCIYNSCYFSNELLFFFLLIGSIFLAEGAWMNQTSLHTELYIQGLLKFSNYTVKVAGFSNFGVGPFSYPIVCATLQDGEKNKKTY